MSVVDRGEPEEWCWDGTAGAKESIGSRRGGVSLVWSVGSRRHELDEAGPAGELTGRRRLVPRTIVGHGRRHRQLGRVAARASLLFPVPPLVEITVGSGVVPGELSVAAVRGAGSSVAEAAHQRLGIRVGMMRPRTRPWSAFETWLTRLLSRFVASTRKPVKQRVAPSRPASARSALVSELRWPSVGNWRRTPERSSCMSRRPSCRNVSVTLSGPPRLVGVPSTPGSARAWRLRSSASRNGGARPASVGL
jgi:hypothetical protein